MAKPTSAGERLQKVLANAGLGSRREIEAWIRDGRVKVDGQTASLGDKVTPDDRITVDDRPVGAKRLQHKERYAILYNKPEGEVVSRDDPDGRPTVFQRLPRLSSGRWIAVGRLDINSSGLMLFTTDGELANRLMHPSRQIEREYAARVLGEVSNEVLNRLVHGVELEDGPARFEDLVESGGEGANRWYHMVIMEGRNREVRRMWEAVGATVNRLKRVRFGPIILDSKITVGRWRNLTPEERKALLAASGLKDDRPWGWVTARGRKPSERGKALKSAASHQSKGPKSFKGYKPPRRRER
jgi:23S rRNA pseudouridine2605 synthase